MSAIVRGSAARGCSGATVACKHMPATQRVLPRSPGPILPTHGYRWGFCKYEAVL